MPLSLEEITVSAVKLHEVAEEGFISQGRFIATIGLVLENAEIHALLPFGPGGRPPSDRFIVAKARECSAHGLVLTAEYWVNPAPLTLRQAAQDPKDLPIPTSLEPSQREEQIITTAVARGEDDVVRVSTPIMRGAYGAQFGRRTSARDSAPMPTGEARHLLRLLAEASKDVP